jgi:hypothetical protein
MKDRMRFIKIESHIQNTKKIILDGSKTERRKEGCGEYKRKLLIYRNKNER